MIRRLRQLSDRQPERRLLAAMLLDAIEEVRSSGEATSLQRRADAIAWISATDVRWPLSFVTVCHALDVDAVTLRAVLLGASETSRPPAR